MALRLIASRIDAEKIRKLGSGAVCVPGLLTKSGVFEYTDSSGKVVREWRPPEEVQKADSIATLKDLPVTERHPKGFVDPATWKATAIGHVSSETVRADKAASGVDADLVVSDGGAIPRIGKDLVEISCGYRVELEDSAGVVPSGMPDAGKPYDRIQRDIVYNHVAIGPRNWGRQGSAVSLRLDGAGDEIEPARADDADGDHDDAKMKTCDCGASMKYDAAKCPNCGRAMPPMRSDAQGKDTSNMLKIRIDGVDFEAATAGELQAKIDAHFAAKAKTDSAKNLERLTGENETLKTQLAQATARADAAPEAARAQIEARASLETSARKVLGAAEKFDGKSDREIRVAVIQRCDAAWKDVGADGKPRSDDSLAGAFETWLTAATAGRVDAASRSIALGLNGLNLSGERVDGAPAPSADEPDSDAARARQRARLDAKNGKGKRTEQKIDGKPVQFN